jgi:hypothetical protein
MKINKNMCLRIKKHDYVWAIYNNDEFDRYEEDFNQNVLRLYKPGSDNPSFVMVNGTYWIDFDSDYWNNTSKPE